MADWFDQQLTTPAKSAPASGAFDLDTEILRAATRYGVRPDLYRSLVKTESSNQAGAVSPKGAIGYAQVMRPTAGDYPHHDVDTPTGNLNIGAEHLSRLLKYYKGDEAKALAAYNAGQGAVDSGRAAKFQETIDYVPKVMKGASTAQTATPAAGGDWFDKTEKDWFSQQGELPPPPEHGALYNSLPNIVTGADGKPSMLGFGSNVISSAGRFASDAVTGITKLPGMAMDAATALYDAPGSSLASLPGKVAGGVKDYAASRYGDYDTALNTLYTDPVGAAADASMVATAGSAPFVAAGKLTGVASLGKVGKALGTAAGVLDPMTTALAPVKAAARTVAKPIYESAFGPQAAKLKARKPGAMERGRQAGYTKPEQVAERIKTIDKTVDTAVTSKATQVTDGDKMFRHFDDLFDHYKNFPEESGHVAKSAEPIVNAGSTPPLADVNDMRKVYGERVQGHFDKQGNPLVPKARMRADLKGYEATREAVHTLIPEMKNLHLEESDLIQFKSALDKALTRSRKAGLFPLGLMVGGGATGNMKAAALGLMKWIVDQPEVKLLAADKLRKFGSRVPKHTRLVTAASRVGAAAGANAMASGPPQSTDLHLTIK
jgi:hypothetical protein